MDNCLFCRIVRREIPAGIVHEDEHTLAFRDIDPKAPTHVLVVPKKHVSRLSELGADDAHVAGRTVAAAAAVARQLGASDYRIVINDGAGAGQSVFHLHVHVLAGRSFTWPPG